MDRQIRSLVLQTLRYLFAQNRFRESTASLKNSVTALVLVAVLTGCGGGEGSGDGCSILGSCGDPFGSQETLADVANSLGFVTPLAYVRRTLPADADNADPNDARELAGFNPGARLYLRSSAASDATEFNITDRAFGANEYDVKDVTVSPDGEKILFSMHQNEADPDDPVFSWSIWEYDLVRDSLRRITSDLSEGLLVHDIDPIYLPNGDILFASTRQSENKKIQVDEGKPQYSGQREASATNANEANHSFNLHIIPASSTDPLTGQTLYDEFTIRQITFNQSHDFSPVMQENGKVLYLRWDNISGTDQFSLYEIDIDGSNASLKYGYHSLANAVDGGRGFPTELRSLASGNVAAIMQEIPNTLGTIGGDMVEIDTNNFIDLNSPTFINSGLSTQAEMSISPDGVAVDNPLSPAGRYLSIWPLRDGSDRFLVSWSPCLAQIPGQSGNSLCQSLPANAVAALRIAEIWIFDPSANTQDLVVRASGNELITDIVAMEPIPLSTAVASNIDATLQSDQLAVLNIRSIYDMDGGDIASGGIAGNADPALTDPATIEAKFLRLVKAVSIPDEDILDFDASIFGVSRNQLMREIIGYVPIEPDGSVRAIVPANIPLMFSIVNAEGKRINIEQPNTSLRHQNWLHLPAGSTLDCRGCHARNSVAPHGRPEAQPPSVHSGGTVSLPYPNTEPALFAPNGGETMAEIFSSANGVAGRTPSIDLNYIDDWTDDSGALTKSPSFILSYRNLGNSPSPASATCDDPDAIPPAQWLPSCRSVINYTTHIQPIWDNNGCTACHTTNGNTQVPAGQLDLTSAASDIDMDQLTSYRELLRADSEQVENNGTLINRTWECNVIDPDTGDAIPDGMGGFLRTTSTADTFLPGFAQVPPSMSESGANFAASRFFYNCLTQDNLANEVNDQICRSYTPQSIPQNFIDPPFECIDIGTALTNEAVVNHNGLLTADELRVIAEWLDIGAQYYNNPFDAP